MKPKLKNLIGYILLGIILFTTFNLFGILVYRTLGLDNQDLLTAFIILLFAVCIFYGYIYFFDLESNYDAIVNPFHI